MRGWAADFLADPRTWVVAVSLAGLALVSARPLARRTGWPVGATAGTLLSAVLVVTLTLAPAPGHLVDGPTVAALTDCVRALADPGAWWQALASTRNQGERVGNVLMFVPVCFFAVLATGRPVVVAAVGALSPVAIEVSQAIISGGRDCAADDWVNNATGAVLGTVAGALLLRAASRG